MSKYFLGIDQGTTGVTALLLDKGFTVVARGYSEITQYYLQNGWVEHDPENIWQALCRATEEAMKKAAAAPDDILAIGIDHEGESVALWDCEAGTPVYPAIVWQDRRTAARAAVLKATHGELFRQRTALTPDSYFSATKIEWILQNTPICHELLAQKRLIAGNMDAWLLYKMTGGAAHKTDASTASRTMLYNIESGTWDKELCALFGIETAILPEIGDSARLFGTACPDAFLGIHAPIGAMLNDQQAALLGQGCIEKGMLKTTYGTGCFMLMNTGDTPIHSPNGLITTVAWQINGKRTYALDGGVYIAGAATRWLQDGLGIISSVRESASLAMSLSDNGGLYFVPAFTGLAAPHWDPYARGMMIGLTGATTRAHIVRATEESIAYQVADLATAMEKDAQAPITLMRCDGGAVHDEFLMQFQSDILNIPLEIPVCTEATARGAAFAAAIGIGMADFKDAKDLFTAQTSYAPTMDADERQRLQKGWQRAVERAKGWQIN
ncbi:MAG: glycerol kinase GlpK [Ruminococcaceae bacterium]|nr:glycerol kinase GlpK [Oscillospiraceae bacterium]